MFFVDELNEVLESPYFKADFDWVRQSMASNRVQQRVLFDRGAASRLNYFVECVLSSAPNWESGDASRICRFGGEVAELLSTLQELEEEKKKELRLRSVLLYELAGLPARSSSILLEGDVYSVIDEMISRKGAFEFLQMNGTIKSLAKVPLTEKSPIVETAMSQDALTLAAYEQGEDNIPQNQVSDVLTEIAKHISIGLKATDILAFSRIIHNRFRLATRSNVDSALFAQARQIGFPAELWSNQVDAIKAGILDNRFDSWGFAAPTGTGKTFLARLLILKTIQEKPDAKILYLVPTRALVYEVSTSLNAALQLSSYTVQAISPQLIDLEDTERDRLEECSVVVLTPEKADLLLRLGVDFMNSAALVIVDEAHHIESDTRGVLLELYLWRIKRILGEQARVVFLSAVAPNIRELAQWMGKNPGGLATTQRATRMRVGVYRLHGIGRNMQGWIEYSDGTRVRIINDNAETTQRRGLVQLAEKLRSAGPILIVTKGKGECENLAVEMKNWLRAQGNLRTLTDEEAQSVEIQRLDSRLEREMYASVEMRELLRNRIAYHHAGLPPRVRVAVEEAIRAGLIDFLFATTTLAEGVNFPFSTVIVQSIALREPPEKGRPSRYHMVTPRSFWNIAGRAGRPGYDREGQAILFELSLGLDKVNAVLENYLNPDLSAIDPVRSALGQSISLIAKGMSNGEFTEESFNSTVLPKSLPKEIHGAVNLLRVGLVHARASKIIASPEELVEGSFASQHLNAEEKAVATNLIHSQDRIVQRFVSNTDSLPIELIAELGVSLETLQLLQDYVRGLSNWQVRKMASVMYGGSVNLSQATYIVSPVAKRMTELEGTALGGFYSEVILYWLAGLPFTVVRSRARNNFSRLEDLISVIYSRVQYLLPWGLYAMHRIVEEEAAKRRIPYNEEIRSLAYLADAGVPNFDALRLVALNLERVDATRLSSMYMRLGIREELNLDIVGWLIREKQEVVEQAVRGSDSRRIDYDLFALIEDLKYSNLQTS